jgi:hypothetical protein
MIRTLLTTVSTFTISYIKGWEVALVMTAVLPVSMLSSYFYINAIQNK